MNTLRRLPRWAQVLLLGGNLFASLAVLVAYWVASYPNLIAAWAQGSVLVVLVPLARTWAERLLAEHRALLRADVKAHVDRALAATAPEGGGSQ